MIEIFKPHNELCLPYSKATTAPLPVKTLSSHILVQTVCTVTWSSKSGPPQTPHSYPWILSHTSSPTQKGYQPFSGCWNHQSIYLWLLNPRLSWTADPRELKHQQFIAATFWPGLIFWIFVLAPNFIIAAYQKPPLIPALKVDMLVLGVFEWLPRCG